MTPEAFNAWLRVVFTLDTWYGLPATQRALSRVGSRRTPEAVWANHYAPNNEYALCSKKLPNLKPSAPDVPAAPTPDEAPATNPANPPVPPAKAPRSPRKASPRTR